MIPAEEDDALSQRRAERSNVCRTTFLLSCRRSRNSGFNMDSRPADGLENCLSAALLASNDKRPRFPSQGQMASDARVFPRSRSLPPNPLAGEAARDVRVFPRSRNLPFGLPNKPLASVSVLAARVLLSPTAPAIAALEANLEIAAFFTRPPRRTAGLGRGAVLAWAAPPPPSSGSSSMDESKDVTQSLSPGFSLQRARPLMPSWL